MAIGFGIFLGKLEDRLIPAAHPRSAVRTPGANRKSRNPSACGLERLSCRLWLRNRFHTICQHITQLWPRADCFNRAGLVSILPSHVFGILIELCRVTAIADGNVKNLSKLNSYMKMIDQCSRVLAPVSIKTISRSSLTTSAPRFTSHCQLWLLGRYRHPTGFCPGNLVHRIPLDYGGIQPIPISKRGDAISSETSTQNCTVR